VSGLLIVLFTLRCNGFGCEGCATTLFGTGSYHVGSTSCWLCAAGTKSTNAAIAPHRWVFTLKVLADRVTAELFTQHLVVK